MAKLGRRYRILLSHETAYFYLYVAGLKSFRSVTGVGLRTFASAPAVFRIEIDDRSQSAVVDSLLELVSRRRKRVVSCSFLITAGRKAIYPLQCGGNGERSRRQIKKFKQSPKTVSRSRLRGRALSSQVVPGVCMVRSLTANRAATRIVQGTTRPSLTRHSIRPEPTLRLTRARH
jgi:hypothetical protein